MTKVKCYVSVSGKYIDIYFILKNNMSVQTGLT